MPACLLPRQLASRSFRALLRPLDAGSVPWLCPLNPSPSPESRELSVQQRRRTLSPYRYLPHACSSRPGGCCDEQLALLAPCATNKLVAASQPGMAAPKSMGMSICIRVRYCNRTTCEQASPPSTIPKAYPSPVGIPWLQLLRAHSQKGSTMGRSRECIGTWM